MPDQDTAEEKQSLEASIDAAIAASGGDARATIRVLLQTNGGLVAEIEHLTELVSSGFTRGRIRRPPIPTEHPEGTGAIDPGQGSGAGIAEAR
jgi:hypothetical protein